MEVTLHSNLTLQSSMRAYLDATEEVERRCPECDHERGGKSQVLIKPANILIVSLKIFWNHLEKMTTPVTCNHDTIYASGLQYRVYAVVSHIGTLLQDGHFIAHVKINGSWTRYDDSKVTSNMHWNADKVANQTPYIFFLRLDPPLLKVLTSAAAVQEESGVLIASAGDNVGPDDTKGSAVEQRTSVKLQGNLRSGILVRSPISWVVAACAALKLMPQELLEQYDEGLEPATVFALWDRHNKTYKNQEHLTGGGITNPDFWPNVLKMIAQQPTLSSASNVFTDFGSEYFVQGLMCALEGYFQEVVGIEVNPEYFEISVELATWVTNKARKEGIYISAIELHQGDFLKLEAVRNITARSTVVYANNVKFGDACNTNLVALWHQCLQNGATMVVFNEKAILSSGSNRVLRGTPQQDWTSKIGIVQAYVNWRPGQPIDVHVWLVQEQQQQQKSAPKPNMPNLSILMGDNVHARLNASSPWTLATVTDLDDTGYTVSFHEGAGSHHLNEEDIKTLDWKHWKNEMKTWTYQDFKDAVASWKIDVSAYDFGENERGAVANGRCQIGVVVAELSGYIANNENGAVIYADPTMDAIVMEHKQVLALHEEEWIRRKKRMVALWGDSETALCIDGYATTCPTLDNLRKHGELGWGALLRSENREEGNCKLVWVQLPKGKLEDGKDTKLKDKDRVAGFLVTTKRVEAGNELTRRNKLDKI